MVLLCNTNFIFYNKLKICVTFFINIMKFRTEINIKPPHFFLLHQQKIVSLGSCFADTIGEKLKENKFNILKNPFGNLFHPIALTKIIDFGINPDKKYQKMHINRDNIWLNYYFHSDISADTIENLENIIDEKINVIHQFIQKIDVLMLTFGTAFIYEHIENQEIVSNCHKQNPNIFQKKLLSIEEITTNFEKTYLSLQKINPNLKIILTLSPVRHSKEDLASDHLSKSILRVATHLISEKYKENIYYFPAFEILNDDLRDYRFYADDLIHPNSQAQNYIWEKFKTIFFDTSTQKIMADWQKIYQNIQHKPRNKNNPDYHIFIEKIKKDLEKINALIDVEDEIGSLLSF
ncbi:MAG: GSCFA family protein [Bacteroidetes bacterium]|nr:MAG: GSCFA family protein [Bacteroidota bacterium]